MCVPGKQKKTFLIYWIVSILLHKHAIIFLWFHSCALLHFAFIKVQQQITSCSKQFIQVYVKKCAAPKLTETIRAVQRWLIFKLANAKKTATTIMWTITIPKIYFSISLGKAWKHCCCCVIAQCSLLWIHKLTIMQIQKWSNIHYNVWIRFGCIWKKFQAFALIYDKYNPSNTTDGWIATIFWSFFAHDAAFEIELLCANWVAIIICIIYCCTLFSSCFAFHPNLQISNFLYILFVSAWFCITMKEMMFSNKKLSLSYKTLAQ